MCLGLLHTEHCPRACRSLYTVLNCFSTQQGHTKCFSQVPRVKTHGTCEKHSLRRNDASLVIFYHYFHANCSSELANCMPPILPRPRCIRFSTHSHSLLFQVPEVVKQKGDTREEYVYCRCLTTQI